MSTRHSITPEARRARLVLFSPQIPAIDAAAVRTDVVNLVMAVEYKGRDSDKAMMIALYIYASNALRDYGHFDPETHLGELYLAAHENRHLGHLADRSIATYNSSIRRVQNGARMHKTRSRSMCAPPYSPAAWAALVDAAETAGRWKQQATLLTVLAGACAMRSPEITKATTDWVNQVGDRVWITVPNSDGVIRRVPVFGNAAEVVVGAVDGDTTGRFLLHPRLASRRNVNWRVKESTMRRSPDFANFYTHRARNTCIARWMNQPIPFSHIAVVADLATPQNHFVGDLLNRMDLPGDDAVEQALAKANGGRR